MARAASNLRPISPDKVRRNPDNPRLIFREDEMKTLLESIKEVGIKVPVTVYEDKNRYYLIDGERRWRCARKLNLPDMPAITQPKPNPLENLLMMFNIHNVRVEWDLMPMALKLAEVRDMLAAEGRPTTPKNLAGITGLGVVTVKRALEVLELPKKYRDLLMREAHKPRDQQKIKVDLFIEINKSRRVVERYAPAVFKEVTKARYVDAMVKKYVTGVVNNVVRYRDVSKIARAERAGVDKKQAAPIILKLVRRPDYKIEQAYEDTVKAAYEIRDLTTRTTGLVDRLSRYRSARRLGDELKAQLRRLRGQINRLLGE